MYHTPDGRGGLFWHPADDNTGLDGSERHQERHAPRASLTRMLKAVSQANYRAVSEAEAGMLAQARRAGNVPAVPPEITAWQEHFAGPAPDCDAPRVAFILNAHGMLDAHVTPRGDSVRMQDDGFTSGP